LGEVDGEGPLPLLEGDTDFPGWVRFATVEYKYVYDKNNYSKPPSEVVLLHAGAVVVPLGTTIPATAQPFRPAEAQGWWWGTMMLANPMPLGPLVGISYQNDWLGELELLMPPVGLITIGLRPEPNAKDLIWVDEYNAPALVARSWKVRNTHSINEGALDVKGLDLIIRPDILGRLGKMYNLPVVELKRTIRIPMDS
jgi:hypothetical protein